MTVENCRLLDWDSEFFGRRIARVNGDTLDAATVAAVDAYCAACQIDAVYFLARSDDPASVAAAEEGGFHMVDIRVTFERDAPTEPRAGDGSVRAFRRGDLQALRRIARDSHRDSRFYADPRFPRESCDRLYEAWIERSCDGWAQAVLVAEVDGVSAGYITCHYDHPAGSIGLVAVGADFRGRGLGQKLVEAALEYFRRAGAPRITVVTQARNLASQRLYQRCGFLTSAVQLWYHRWSSRSS